MKKLFPHGLRSTSFAITCTAVLMLFAAFPIWRKSSSAVLIFEGPVLSLSAPLKQGAAVYRKLEVSKGGQTMALLLCSGKCKGGKSVFKLSDLNIGATVRVAAKKVKKAALSGSNHQVIEIARIGEAVKIGRFLTLGRPGVKAKGEAWRKGNFKEVLEDGSFRVVPAMVCISSCPAGTQQVEIEKSERQELILNGKYDKRGIFRVTAATGLKAGIDYPAASAPVKTFPQVVTFNGKCASPGQNLLIALSEQRLESTLEVVQSCENSRAWHWQTTVPAAGSYILTVAAWDGVSYVPQDARVFWAE